MSTDGHIECALDLRIAPTRNQIHMASIIHRIKMHDVV